MLPLNVNVVELDAELHTVTCPPVKLPATDVGYTMMESTPVVALAQVPLVTTAL